MIRKLLSLAVLLACISVLQVGCGSDGDDPPAGPTPLPEPRLVVEAHQDPTIDNALTSPVWDSIDAVTVPIGYDNNYNANRLYIDNYTVSMKTLIADDSILYIWAKWNDNDEDNRFSQLRASWTINAKVEWAVHYPEDTSEAAFNEDRFYMIFDKGGTNGADCAAFCHTAGNESADDRLFYGTAGDNADVWHWKAHRTGLANLAEDMHITSTNVAPDAGDEMYYPNHAFRLSEQNGSFITEPKYVHESGVNYSEPGLLESEIQNISGLFLPYDDLGVPESDWIIFIPDQPPVGKTVPGYYIYDRSGDDGSRWDVQAVSDHDGSAWTVVFRRAITTGDGADINFDFATLDSVEVTIGITDNSGIQHFGRAPFYLVFP